MKDGVIADFNITELMLKYFIHKAHSNRFGWRRPRLVIAVPSGITAVEKRAVRNTQPALGLGRSIVFPNYGRWAGLPGRAYWFNDRRYWWWYHRSRGY